jgi:hypothetical protein
MFLNGLHQLPSGHMDYVMCYYRPENKFPDRAFGGFARELANPQRCSMDLVTYVNHKATPGLDWGSEGWSLHESLPIELWELDHYYRYHSGGMFMNAIDLGKKSQGMNALEEEFKVLGFLRRWQTFSLTYKDRLAAVFVVNQSDIGINLSELLNGITVFIVNKNLSTWDIIKVALSKLSIFYPVDKVPLLVYPPDALEPEPSSNLKIYQLWITDMRYVTLFFEYMQNRFRMKFE